MARKGKKSRRIVIIAGPNGAGNTTFAEQFLLGEAECPDFINADLIAQGPSPFATGTADFAINQAWLTTALIAHDLLAWTRMICLDGELARAEPKKLRYCLLHAAGIIARTGRRTRLRIAENWPWVTDLVHAFHRVELIALRV